MKGEDGGNKVFVTFGKIHLRGREEKKRPLCHPPRDQGQNDFHAIFRRQTSAYWNGMPCPCYAYGGKIAFS